METQIQKLTIITVVMNCRSGIELTTDSVFKQTYSNIEYVIVDGGSTDGTLEYLKGLNRGVSLISGPDNGIYDAMNKGLSLASGDFVLFLNAGDYLVEKDTISCLLENRKPGCSIIYGDIVTYDSNEEILVKQIPVKNGVVRNICHQGIAYNRNKIGSLLHFEARYDICADFAVLVLIMQECGIESLCGTNVIVTKYLKGGYSEKNVGSRLKQRWDIISNSRLLLITKLLTNMNTVRLFIHDIFTIIIRKKKN